MKRLLFALLLMCWATLCLPMTVQGQISSSSERVFYTRLGSKASEIKYCVLFETGKVWLKSVSYTDVRKNLAQSSSYYNHITWRDRGTLMQNGSQEDARVFTYCSQLSKPNRIVYKRHVECTYFEPYPMMSLSSPYGVVKVKYHGNMMGAPVTYYICYDEYVAFTPDKSSFTYWREKSNNHDGTLDYKESFSIVPKSQLLPIPVNYDDELW